MTATQGRTQIFLKLKEVENPTMKTLLAKASAFKTAMEESMKAVSRTNHIETNHEVREETAKECFATLAATCQGCGSNRHTWD